MNETLELTITRTIPASAKTVFEAWLDPALLAAFMKPMPGMADCDVEVDAREGGAFSIVMKAGDTDVPVHGEYKTVSKYDTLAFTWLSAHSGADSVVTLTFSETAPNECELTLHHVGFPSEKSRDDHNGGWGNIIDQLTQSVS